MLSVFSASIGIPGQNRTGNYALGERGYLHLTTGTYVLFYDAIIIKILLISFHVNVCF